MIVRTNNFHHLLLLIVLFLVGCSDEAEMSKDPGKNSWKSLAKFPAGSLSEAVSFTVGENLFVGTGLTGVSSSNLNNNYVNKFYVFSTDENSWNAIASLPSDIRANAISFSIGSYGYVGLGMNCLGTGNCAYSYFNDLWRYDPANDSWAQMADFPGTPRAYATSFVIGEKAYVMGGSTIDQSELWEYNSKSNEWMKKSDYPGICNSRAVSFSLDGLGYVGLGMGRRFSSNEFWEYNPITDTWIEKQEFPGEARYDASAFSFMGKGYLACGIYQESTDHKYLTDIWVYDNANDVWTQVNTIYPGMGRLNLIGGVIDSRLILGLGSDNYFARPSDGIDDIWEYLP